MARRATPKTVSKAARDVERDAAELMSKALDRKVERRPIGDEAQKHDLGRDLSGCEPFAVQVKHGQRINIRLAVEEAEAGCDGKMWKVPVAYVRFVGDTAAIVAMRADDWVKLAKHGVRLRQAKPERVALPQGVSVSLAGEPTDEEFAVEEPREPELELQ